MAQLLKSIMMYLPIYVVHTTCIIKGQLWSFQALKVDESPLVIWKLDHVGWSNNIIQTLKNNQHNSTLFGKGVDKCSSKLTVFTATLEYTVYLMDNNGGCFVTFTLWANIDHVNSNLIRTTREISLGIHYSCTVTHK